MVKVKMRAVLEQAYQFKIKAELDVESAVYVTRTLYNYVNQGDISLEINARKGSLITEIIVTVLTGLATDILYDITKIIYKLLKNIKEENKKVKPVYILTEREQFIITGDKDSKIPEDLKKELFK